MSGKIAAARPNPVGPTRRQIVEAGELFKEFSGHDPETVTRVKLQVPKTGLVIGELDGVLYTAIRDGEREPYIHRFKKSSRPTLVASSDGKSLHIIGGKYAFTDRGIVDH